MKNSTATTFPNFKSDRLVLRPLSDYDLQEIFLLRTDEVVNKYLNRKPCLTLEDAKEFITNTIEIVKSEKLNYWAIELIATKKIIGTICLFKVENKPDTCEMGYELLPSYHRLGIMSEAVAMVLSYAHETVRLQNIEAFVHQDNLQSIGLLQKFNFCKVSMQSKYNDGTLLYQLNL
ncbi:hypothetical protein FFWV33_02745 [Flavobacterium faecale]|uniref:N-acetyltransferase domain-containing protein n=1 Tax=Flavobacterium faecale TaxID=1355330 RepID=A0A2S1L9U1_9FLAO|nr:GNAT family N-acetyltransferase [Flavobacterium faecale]AWG20523.1 hypothetical protein FFWV33_02745 [Flavobacterium faecale]